MINQKSFEHNGFKYLMVALQLDDKVVIRVTRDGKFLFDNEMLSETYSDGIATGLNLLDEVFDITESEIRNKRTL